MNPDFDRVHPQGIPNIHVKFGFDMYNDTQVIAQTRRISGSASGSGCGDRGENIVSPPTPSGDTIRKTYNTLYIMYFQAGKPQISNW